MSSQEVLTIIASLNGGFNGEVLGKQINVEILSPTEAIYTLKYFENNQPTGESERYALTLVELPPLPVDPNDPLEGSASTGGGGLPIELEETQPFDSNTEEPS
ncbi:hypothetical protein HOT31_gp075 [Microbacterium phage Hendrix]|uniref:Uncharacterized protein n=1 Tax=Microbacterium phage Hendrix TaxID=2182341 RepID=A0A2U8UUQ9_9CAUD|nr:hypothetical protein HOT31_gp075 [Microbacterium phage Hendrix]AWN07746.1 hypothetical protein PBI_HENDRIX_75 [Microbacterium phage Hendrix]